MFVEQMARFHCVDWECVPPPKVVSYHKQMAWMNERASSVSGEQCKKLSHYAMCDLRPAYGEMFADRYAGYDFWGWCDLDVLFGDLDRLLPPLLENADVLSFKHAYLSGCCAIFRNVPEVTGLYKTSPVWRRVLADTAYHFWDESGHDRHFPGEPSFYRTIELASVREGGKLRVAYAPDLYLAETVDDRQYVTLTDGKLLTQGVEVALLHFMNDLWPIKPDGTSRWL
jgi:hypothetical protein